MSSIFKFNPFSVLAVGSCVGAIALAGGCGGGGGGNSSSTPSGTPSPLDATYSATYVPTDNIPSGGKAPTGTLVVNNGRGTASFTYYLLPSVISKYQPIIDKALTQYGVAGDIRNNQIPTSITFNGAKNIDGSGKYTFTAAQSVKVCGTATLTVDSTFLETGGGLGTYNLVFDDHFSVNARGRVIAIAAKEGNCRGLPNKSGSATFSRPTPTATPLPTVTPIPSSTPTAN